MQASIRLCDVATRNRALRNRVDSLRRERMLFEDLRKWVIMRLTKAGGVWKLVQ